MIILIIGGSGSGKSEYAESLALKLKKERVYYIATMMPFGEDSINRIKRHKKLRKGKDFILIERYRDVGSINIGDTIILECLSNLLNNEYFGKESKGSDYILRSINNIRCDNLIIVSNNIFEDGIIYDNDTKRYIEELSKLNIALANVADEVIEVVCGIPIKIK